MEIHARPAVLIKAVGFAALTVPGLLLAHAYLSGALASPFRTIVQETGLWSMRLLVLGLMMGPLRDVTGWTWPAALRRMVGLFAAFYAAVHVVAWTRQYGFDWPFLLAEVARPWLVAGAVAAAALVPLAATSMSAAHRRLGPVLWGRIHRLVYAAAAMAVLHYALARGLTRTEVAIDALLVGLALLWRAIARKRLRPGARPAAPA